MLSRHLCNIKEFDIFEQIGKGKFSLVYRAVKKAHGRHPAIECALKYLDKDAVESDKFIKEIELQNKLKHEAILSLVGFTIPLFGVGDYIVITKLMPNGTLTKLLERASKGTSPSDWDTINAINIFGIAAGMAFIHQNNIIHRDLKPDNIMVDENYYPKIADFGLSKLLDPSSQIVQTVGIGTPYYMAPEVFENDDYTELADVYSYAIILYQLTTLKDPWGDKAKSGFFTFIQYVKSGGRPKINEGELSEDYKELIERCWDEDPTVRPSFIQIVKGFMDNKDVYFPSEAIDSGIFEDYIERVTQDLDFTDL